MRRAEETASTAAVGFCCLHDAVFAMSGTKEAATASRFSRCSGAVIASGRGCGGPIIDAGVICRRVAEETHGEDDKNI